MKIYLETERLILRHFTPDDADNLVMLDGDPEVLRYLNGGTPTPRDFIVRDTLPRFFSYDEIGRGYGVWAAIEKGTGAFLGRFILRPKRDTEPDAWDLGYRLRRSAWGQGYATEGSRALLRKAFTELGVRRVTAGTLVANVASWRVMEKAGLTIVGTDRKTFPGLYNDEEQEVVGYAITKEDWERAQR
jgi:RimJ/RimL family protein N-acetyltransferase